MYVLGSPNLAKGVNDAARTYRTGLARGFQALGVSTEIIDHRALANLIRNGRIGTDHVVVAAVWDIAALSKAQRRALRETQLVVWVSQWFPNQRSFCARNNLPDVGMSMRTARATLDCEPKAIFTSNTSSCFDFYENWIVEFGQLLSFPLAYDRTFYEQTAARERPELVDRVAFVGGYWGYKGRNLRKFLLPFADRLVIYGYSTWPFGDYRGRLPERDEADVLRSAAVVPGVNEPHADVMGGDVCERVYKVAGLGGLCVADLCFGYRDLFEEDELLMPRSYHDYLETVGAILAGELDTQPYRERGREAVYERHLYEHRAAEMLAALQVEKDWASVSTSQAEVALPPVVTSIAPMTTEQAHQHERELGALPTRLLTAARRIRGHKTGDVFRWDDPQVQRLALALRNRLGLLRAIETGTFEGRTARVLSGVFDSVTTIELSLEIYRRARHNLRDSPSVEVVHGDSRDVLPKIVDGSIPTLYWLDGHWSGGATAGIDDECPVLTELDAIAAGHPDDCIFIDDARLFLASPQPPHRTRDWPTFAEVFDELRSIRPGHHVTVIANAVLSVPDVAKDIVDAFSHVRYPDVGSRRARMSSPASSI